MAKLTNPLMSQDARGSVSGLQFSRNRTGNFASRKSTGTRAQRGDSTNWRSQIKAAHSAWLILSAELVAQWNAFAPPTQTGRNAFIGAYLTNLMIGRPVFTKSPLEHVTGTPYSNLKARIRPGDPPRVDVTWPMTPPKDDAVIGYTYVGVGQSIPHLRKFKYGGHGAGFDGGIIIPIPYHNGFCALRLLHWDYTRGRPIAEYRALLIDDVWNQITPV